MKKLLPLVFLIVGGAIGGGAGVFLNPELAAPCDEAAEDACDTETKVAHSKADASEDREDQSYVAMKNQFVVPVVRNELVGSLVVLSLSLEAEPDAATTIFSKEPKLRDAFLRVLFDHAHIGGFNGTFTESARLSALRIALLEAAQSVLGPIVSDVLITDIARQEM